MITISRILCPVDFSETSKRAFEYGLALAGQLGAELDVIHVFQLPAYIESPFRSQRRDRTERCRSAAPCIVIRPSAAVA